MVKPKVYKRRWYILMLFASMSMYQGAIWNTWGPVEKAALAGYPSWSTSTIGLLANWSNIAMYLGLVPCMILVKKDLRQAVVWGSGFLIASGTLLRCITIVWPEASDTVFTALCHVGAFLNAFAGIVLCSAPMALSAAWFPVQERVTATSIGQMFDDLGGAVIYFLGVLLVPDSPPPAQDNTTVSQGEMVVYRREIQNYLSVLTVPAVLLFLLVLVYFPAGPPTPPSYSSAEERLSLVGGTKKILKSWNFIALMVANSLSQAVCEVYRAIMVTNLSQVGVGGEYFTENWIGKVGIVSSVASTAAAILSARFTDRIQGHIKLTSVVLLALSSLLYILLTLIVVQVISVKEFYSLEVAVFVLLVLGNSICQSVQPLLSELAVEVCYPVSEIVVGGAMFLSYGTVSMVFLLIFSIPSLSTDWLNYVLPISTVVSAVLLLTVRENYGRLVLDQE